MRKGPGDRHNGGRGSDAPSAPADMVQDWITIWQSELSAIATDREVQQAWSTMVAMWATDARAAAALIPPGLNQARPQDGSPGRPSPEPPARPSPASASSDAGERAADRRTIDLLARRVEELERRLAELADRAPKP